MSAAWDHVRDVLRAEFGDAAFKSWLAPIELESISGTKAVISAPTRFMRDWVARHYLDRILELFRDGEGDVKSVDLMVRSVARSATPAPSHAAPPVDRNRAAPSSSAPVRARPSAKPHGSARANHDDVSAPLDPRFTFDNFIVGKSNEFAYAAARRLAEAPNVPFNPLFLYGGVGLGKTHFMHAIAWHIRKADPTRRVIYLSAEKFMYQFIRALRFQDTMAFKEQFR